VVATPIGNAEDISLRALRILASVDAIACEDTRVTAKLLARHGIRVSLLSYHEHNAFRMRPELLRRLADGGRIALVADVGTPLISDPGLRLVREYADAGFPVVAVPGPSAVTAALSVAGLPTDRFLFAGFPPSRGPARRRFLVELATVPATLVLLESPRRLAASLADMAQVLGPRQATVGRELTKRFEEVRRGSLTELAEAAVAEDVRGEITIVVAPPEADTTVVDEADLDERLDEALAKVSVRDAADQVAATTGLPRRSVYARALQRARRTR